MPNCVSTKGSIIVNAIAITIALAVVAGYQPIKLNPMQQFQAFLQTQNLLHR